MVSNTAADFPDCYTQGPGDLNLDALPGPGTGERTLGREFKVGESRFYLLAVGCVVLGKTLTVWTPLSPPIAPTCSEGVTGWP